ncbi:MAG: hypothetical protein IPK17_15080 [Chloroflexi bacterium]|uniref:hypothetical protein n=1 Tax=Candidatus Flexifilum breve TaxID=3140694 RepID=UPI003136242E|nr:hypothetical protein [Chloroflexota bacterium]
MNQEIIEDTTEDLFNILSWGELPSPQEFANYFRSKLENQNHGEVGYMLLEKLQPFVDEVLELLEDEFGG